MRPWPAATAARVLPAGAPAPRTRVRAYLHPGRLFAAAEPYAVTTVLGSCVAVCLWDARLRIGGLNHYLLPFHAAQEERSGRFGNAAIAGLLERLLALGSRRHDLVAKVYGGACVMAMFREGGSDLGGKNVQIAFQTLEHEGIPVVEDDVRGDRGRRLTYHTDDGESRIQFL